MGDRSERVQAILDLYEGDFEDAMEALLGAASPTQRAAFRTLLAEEHVCGDPCYAGGRCIEEPTDDGHRLSCPFPAKRCTCGKQETPTRIEEAGLALIKAGKAYAKDSRGGALGDLQSAASDYGAALHDAGWL